MNFILSLTELFHELIADNILDTVSDTNNPNMEGDGTSAAPVVSGAALFLF